MYGIFFNEVSRGSRRTFAIAGRDLPRLAPFGSRDRRGDLRFRGLKVEITVCDDRMNQKNPLVIKKQCLGQEIN